ncbi:ABC transporter permease [Xanthobacter sp. ZOL 2024]
MAFAAKRTEARKPIILSAFWSEKARTLGVSLLSFLVMLLIWSVVSGAGLVKPIFLPGPQAVLNRLIQVAASGQLWSDLSISLWRISFAFVLSAAMAIPGGIMMGVYGRLNTAVEPVIDFIRYMPVVAFVPLSILWFGTNEIQKYAIIWMGTFFQQILMVQDCVKRVPRDLLDVGRTLEMSRPKIMWRIVLPAAAPGIWDALRITMGWAWSWLVLAELVAATNGLGYRITIAQRYLQTDLIIGYVLVLGFLGLITDQIMRRAEHRMFRYLRPRP